jgi:hypothetical protein
MKTKHVRFQTPIKVRGRATAETRNEHLAEYLPGQGVVLVSLADYPQETVIVPLANVAFLIVDTAEIPSPETKKK